MEDFFSGSDAMLEALRNPTISPDQEKLDSEGSEGSEDSGDIEETALLKEIMFGIAEIKSMIRESTPIAAEQPADPATVPAYTSQMLEGI